MVCAHQKGMSKKTLYELSVMSLLILATTFVCYGDYRGKEHVLNLVEDSQIELVAVIVPAVGDHLRVLKQLRVTTQE